MAQLTIPPICPHCKQPVQQGEPQRVCGFDLSRWPDVPPANLTGHAACAAGRDPVLLTTHG